VAYNAHVSDVLGEIRFHTGLLSCAASGVQARSVLSVAGAGLRLGEFLLLGKESVAANRAANFASTKFRAAYLGLFPLRNGMPRIVKRRRTIEKSPGPFSRLCGTFSPPHTPRMLAHPIAFRQRKAGCAPGARALHGWFQRGLSLTSSKRPAILSNPLAPKSEADVRRAGWRRGEAKVFLYAMRLPREIRSAREEHAAKKERGPYLLSPEQSSYSFFAGSERA
jgi:hypothetical protein